MIGVSHATPTTEKGITEMGKWSKISTKNLRKSKQSFEKAARDAAANGNRQLSAEAASEAQQIQNELYNRR